MPLAGSEELSNTHWMGIQKGMLGYSDQDLHLVIWLTCQCSVMVKKTGLVSGRSRFKFPFVLWKLKDDLRTVLQPNLSHRVIVKIKWRWGESFKVLFGERWDINKQTNPPFWKKEDHSTWFHTCNNIQVFFTWERIGRPDFIDFLIVLKCAKNPESH